jgi:hypothetical protein
MSFEEAGCQYIGPLPLSQIASIIAAQSTETTTQPSSSAGPMG